MTSLADVVHNTLTKKHDSDKDSANRQEQEQKDAEESHADVNHTEREVNGDANKMHHAEGSKQDEQRQKKPDAVSNHLQSQVNGDMHSSGSQVHEANGQDYFHESRQDYHDAMSRHFTPLANGDAREAFQNREFPPKDHGKHVVFKHSPTTSPRLPPMDTPSGRTGPPRSLSYNYPSSPRARQGSLSLANGDISEESDDMLRPNFSRGPPTEYRGALEYSDPEQREREREAAEKKERHRQNRMLLDETWNPLKWLGGIAELQASSPRDEGHEFVESPVTERNTEKEREGVTEKTEQEGQIKEVDETTEANRNVGQSPIRSTDLQSMAKRWRSSRAQSLPHVRQQDDAKRPTTPKWNRLRSLIPTIAHQGKEQSQPGQTAVQGQTVNITDELIAGGLSTLMLRLWFERDEHDRRRVPVLLHRLRLRISDSLHPLSGHKAVFRIECEYANGAMRWVIYRQLRDFISLHTHYRLSNAYNHNVDALPEFPRTSLPYFKFLKKEGREKGRDLGRADFAVLQREALENYLIGLIRAVMFHPTSNRLAGFLEISALSIQLAQSGGYQAKAGFLTIETATSKLGSFGRKNASRRDKRKQRWCAVRESYIVALDEPGETKIWDVFLLDADFAIERPTRYYRQGLNLLQADGNSGGMTQIKRDGLGMKVVEQQHHTHETLHKLKVRISKTFHVGRRRQHRRSSSSTPRSRRRSASTTSSDSETSVSSQSQRSATMVDPSTNMNPADGGSGRATPTDETFPDDSAQKRKKRRSQDASKHTFFVSNAQMKLKLVAKSERQLQQWITALEKSAAASHWTGKNRFDSYAPIRLNVAAQWLVDGRDYMWNLSRAILLAREQIYIHDWWLSPELQMRRPHKENYRLDKLLERKAKEGVKIYIILYKEVSSRTTPTDSNYTKQYLMNLHRNIMVQRSPSHFQTGTFYWAHHEKLCVIDEAIAFMGGIDLCFGRWDTPQHVLIDDPEPGPDGTSEQIWQGKDYSNPRISDFFALHKPDDDMYDRSKVPRMPWHDVGMHVVGQPARDLCRHFVERWNYLLRIKNHTREFPFLLPPPDFRASDLTEQGLTGTCEMQICRSGGGWSLGTPAKVEHSIQNAYLKAIQLSDHFVYIENQFFITSTVVNDTPVENKIGDALVHRIIRAHREGTPWKACIVIPLLPGFPYPVDHGDASAVRIILECQNRTLFRGPDSIFSRLRKEGIDPDNHIAVFSLRNWGKLPGDVLTTEEVYIHGKVCIVDDRLAIIGSANVNERSQRGDRDSELAAIIRDTDMLDGSMAGKPYKVGRFAHTLRVRLMREHIGVDVDGMYEEDLMSTSAAKPDDEQVAWDPDDEQVYEHDEEGVTRTGHVKRLRPVREIVKETLDSAEQAIHGTDIAAARDAGFYLRKVGIKSRGFDAGADENNLKEERQTYTKTGEKVPGFASASVPTLEEKTIMEKRPPHWQANGDAEPILEEIGSPEDVDKELKRHDADPPVARVHDGSHELFGAPADASGGPGEDNAPPNAKYGKSDDSDEDQAAVKARDIIRKHLSAKVGAKPWTMPTPTPIVDPHGFEDPICDKFWKNVWVASATHNTEIYRKVFHSIPDDTVTTWKQYKEFVLHHERLNKPPKGQTTPEPVARVPSEAGDEGVPQPPPGPSEKAENETIEGVKDLENVVRSNGTHDQKQSNPAADVHEDPRMRQPARADEPFEKWEREEMEELLGETCGHLVLYPTRFLEGEDIANNFLFNADRLLPMPIYD